MTGAAAPLDALLAASPLPAPGGDKERRGALVVVGGAATCPGAAILSGTAALRAGAGRVQLAVHPDVDAAVGAAFPEAFVVGWCPGDPVPDALRHRFEGADAVLVGPGLGDEGVAAATEVAQWCDGHPLLLDAMALPAARQLAARGAPPLLVAPNPDEAAELVGSTADDEADLHALAAAVTGVTGGPVAVRGTDTVVHDGRGGAWSAPGGNTGLGTAGSGDVLVGVAGGLLARGADGLTALAWAVAAHARAGASLAAARPVGYLAREIADAIPAALAALADARARP